MFLNIMAKIGKAIYDRGIMSDDRIWLGHNYISPTYMLVIDLRGKLRRLDDLAKEKNKKVIAAPLGCYEGIWSDTNNKFHDYPYLIHDRMGILCPNDDGYAVARERYLNKLKEASEYVKDDRVNAVLNFALKTNIKEVAKKEGINLRLDDFFCISISVDKTEQNLWEDAGLKQHMAEFFLEQLKQCKTQECICEVTGWKASYFITKHSQLISRDKARAVTMKTYNEEYGGDMDDFVVTQIGAESAAYYDFAILYIDAKTYFARREEIRYLETLEGSEKQRQIQNERIVYFGSIDGEVLLPVTLNYGWMATYVKTKYGVPYKEFSVFLHDKAATTPFCAVEYGVLDRRIVAYNAIIYTCKESEKMIENVLTWINACQTHDKAYGILDVCRLLYGNNDLQYRSFFIQRVLLGKWDELAATMLPACYWDADLYYPVIKMLRRGGFDMQKITEEPDYLIGCLYAYAVLIERKHAYLVGGGKVEEKAMQRLKNDVENGEATNLKGGDENRKNRQERIKLMMTRYFQNPLETWKDIRVEIERLTCSEANKYHKLIYCVSALEERLAFEDGWYLAKKNEGAILIGYDCTMKKYYTEMREMLVEEENNEESRDNAVV